jgi:hypothetical protein
MRILPGLASGDLPADDPGRRFRKIDMHSGRGHFHNLVIVSIDKRYLGTPARS